MRRWLIKALGGYTDITYYDLKSKYDILLEDHESLENLYKSLQVERNAPIMVIPKKMQEHIEILEKRIAHMLADELLKLNLIIFSIEDHPYTFEKVLKGFIELVVPK